MSKSSVGNLIHRLIISLSASTTLRIAPDIDAWHIHERKSWPMRRWYEPEAKKLRQAKICEQKEIFNI